MKNIRYIIPSILFAMVLATSCEDMMTKKIDIDSADFPPRIAVTATLDSDSGRFTMVLYEGKSLASYNQNDPGEQPIIKNGVVNLYQDGQLVWTLAGAFDLRRYKYYETYESTQGHQKISVKDIPVKAGSTYKLEIDVDGYEKAVSTVVMPADPLVSDVSMDTDKPMEKRNINNVNYHGGWGGPYYPVKLSLEDNTSGQDYYALQMKRFEKSDNEKHPYGAGVEENMGVGVSNLALIQDNPDRESESSLFGDGESYDLYIFGTLLISDITFPGSRSALELFVSSFTNNGNWNVYPDRLPGYNPAVHGPEVILDRQYTLLVKHITAETFKHYRSLKLQEQGMGFFAEPVVITSNVENGYGCFSLQNTRRVVLKKYQLYYYPEMRFPGEVYY